MPLPTFRVFLMSAAIFVWASIYSLAQELPQRSFTILVTFDYPGTSLTIAHGINQYGDVVGEFTNITGAHGFIRFRDGTFSPPITHPDDPDGETFGFDINRSTLVGA